MTASAPSKDETLDSALRVAEYQSNSPIISETCRRARLEIERLTGVEGLYHQACGEVTRLRGNIALPHELRELLATAVHAAGKMEVEQKRGAFRSCYEVDALIASAPRLRHYLYESKSAPETPLKHSGECICPTCGIRHGAAATDGGF